MTLLKLALKNTRAKPGRFLLTSAAVLIGVALTTAVFIFSDSLRDTFGDLSQDIESGFDLAVRSEIPFGDRDTAPPVSPELIDRLDAIDGVAAVQPRIQEFGVVPNDANGEAVTPDGGPNIAVNWEDRSPVPRLFLIDGRAPTEFGQFALDLDAAADDGFIIGDTYGVQTPKGLIPMEFVGTFSFGSPTENAAVGAKLLAVDTATALDLFNDNRGYDNITLTTEPGANQDAIIAAVTDILPEGLEIATREELANEQAEEFNTFIGIFRTILLVFAFVILFVAAFIIYNVFSIIIGQRIQEIGLLRALGATGKQITRSIAAEALAVGIFSTVVGIALGIPFAWSLQKILGAVGFGPDEAKVPLRPTTIIVAVILGIGLTMAAAIWPALRARKVSPMAALASTTHIDETIKLNPLFGGLTALAGVLLVVLGFVSDNYLVLLVLAVVSSVLIYLGLSRVNPLISRFSLVTLAIIYLIVALVADLRASMLLSLLGAAAIVTFLGMNLLAPLFARPLSRVLGAPLATVGGIPSKIARDNAGRNPERTASAASALMIGLALITSVSVLGSSFKATFASVLRDAVTSDWIVLGGDGGPDGGFSAAIAPELAAVDGVEGVLGVKWATESFRTLADQDVRDLYATNLADVEGHFDADFVAKDDSLIGPNAVFVHEDPADDLNLEVGSTVAVEFKDEEPLDLTVAGIYSDLAIFDSGWVIDSVLWAERGTETQDTYVTLLTGGNTDDALRSDIEEVLTGFSQVTAETKAEFQENREKQIDQVLSIITILLSVSIVLALLGVAITLALSVFERTREIGLTRAVGGTRKQIKRIVRSEGLIVALFGGVLGVAVGLVLGFALVQIIPDDFVNTLSIPWFSMFIWLIIAAVAGMLAAWFPARRAAKLNVLDAISQG